MHGRRLQRRPGGTSQAIATGQANPQGLVLDDVYVYWANNSSPGAVVRGAKNGTGSPFTLATSQYFAYRLFLDGSTLYYVGDTTAGFLRSVGKSGGAVTTLQSASSPKGVVVDGSTIYWTHFGEIRKADTTALASVTKLSNVEQFPGALAQDATNLYWVDLYADRVRALPKVGGTPKTLATLADGANRAALAVDATHVFFVDPKGNVVRKVPKDGSRPAVTIASASDPSGIAIDATHVFWANAGDGTIKRVAK